MTMIWLQARVVYKDIEGGFWGLIDDNGQQFLPINMPEQLKVVDKQVRVGGYIREDIAGIHMWGQYFEIQSFTTG